MRRLYSRNLTLAGLAIAISVTLVTPFADTRATARVADLRSDALAKATRQDRNGWVYIHLEGTPEQVGYQHGWLLAREIEDALRVFKVFLQRTTKYDWKFYRDSAHEIFWNKIDDEYKREIEAIARGAYDRGVKIDRDDVLAMNGWMELAWYYAPTVRQAGANDPEIRKSPPPACSAFIATGSWTRGGEIVIAHNAWIDYLIGRRWNIMVDLKPARGHRILMDSFPGFIHSGDDFYVTDAGLMITETTISDFKGFDPAGLPEFLRVRKATQYADSIDDWLKVMMDRSNGGYANDWLIGDRKTGEIARLENGLKNNVVERTKDGYYVGSNFPVHEKTAREETTFDLKNADNSANARRRRWEQLMSENRGKIDITLAKKFMGDHYDVARKQTRGSGTTLCGHIEADERGISEDWGPFYPAGASNGKASTSTLANQMKLWGVVGHPCGEDFKLESFLKAHPDYGWQREIAADMPGGQWTLFSISQPAAAGAETGGGPKINDDRRGINTPQTRRMPEDPSPPLPGETRRPPGDRKPPR